MVLRSLVLAFLLLYCNLLHAQLFFSTLKPSDGLSSRETRCVFRDAEGFVWVGTNNGLNRFDGSHFKLYNKLAPGYPQSLGETITCLAERGTGHIWFGTNAGIGVLDKHTNQIREIPVKGSFRGNRLSIGKLEQDGEGRIWANTNRGLFVENKDSFVPVSALYPFCAELDERSYYHAAFLFDSTRNCFWMGTASGSFCLDLKNRQLYSAANNPARNPFLTKDAIISLALDRSGNLWYSNSIKSTLAAYNLITGKFQEMEAINNNPAWKLEAGCNTLFVDRQDRLWISTWIYSTFIRYPNGRFEEIPYQRELPHSIGYGFFTDAFQDAYRNIWLTTINGLSKLSANQFVETIVQAPSFPFYLPTGFANINAMELDGNGNWWLAKMEGLVKYHVATRKFERFLVSPTDLRGNEIFKLAWMDGKLWCNTTKGVRIFDTATKSFRLFDELDTKENAAVYAAWLLRDAKGFVWASLWDKGVYRYDPRNRQSVRFSDSTSVNWGDMKTKRSSTAFQTSNGNVWVAVGEDGVRIFDTLRKRFIRPGGTILSTDLVTSMTEDDQHHIWLATSRHGLIKANQNGEVLDSITRKDGLTLKRYHQLCFDASGRLWAISREDLLSISVASKEVTKVNIPVTFSFNDHWNSLLRKGHLIYATMLDNVVVINTNLYQRFPEQHSPLLSGFQVFGKNMPFSSDSSIQLKHNQNFFSFEFSSPFHQEVLSMQYAYMLEGFDKDWVYAGRKLTASYTNVPDGSYRFLVKTTDEKGRWMDKVSALEIDILPPWWKQWWFLSLVAVLVAVSIRGVYLFLQKRKNDRLIEETIDYFANSLYGENSINEICWDIARNCISQLKLEDCVVYLFDETRDAFVPKAAYGPKNPKGQEIVNPIELKSGEGIVGAAAALGKPVLVKDTTRDTRYKVDDKHRPSELAVPIIHEGKVIGVLDSEHSRKNFFTEQHQKALSTIAAISANKIAEARAEELAKKSQLQLMEIKKLLAESQLMALRAQMNPHFVFNCLNSIQECIVTEKYGEASLYLNKFSKLFRCVLNNSGKLLVTLAEEIEVLELYLALEHMRFEKSFQYDFYVEEDLETDEILVPSMLLQPYVENALWHGLMHKESDRRLHLRFEKISDEVFQCVIDDNGIGRKKALELKAKQSKSKRHVSRGMSISRDRIELLQKQKQHATLNIIDKYEGEEARGTRVVVELSTYLQMS